MPELSHTLWDLEKFRALPLYRLWDYYTPEPRSEVSLFCLLHVSSKPSLLTQLTAVGLESASVWPPGKLIVVDVFPLHMSSGI